MKGHLVGLNGEICFGRKIAKTKNIEFKLIRYGLTNISARFGWSKSRIKNLATRDVLHVKL